MDAVIINLQDRSIAYLPSEVIEKILEHLRGRDLLKASLVCRTFHETIGSSQKLMNKIRLKFRPSLPSDATDLESILDETVRTYEHISLTDAQCDSDEYIKIFTFYNKWKSVKMYRCNFRSINGEFKFLSTISETVEALDFEGSGYNDGALVYKYYGKTKFPIRFPKLISLNYKSAKTATYIDYKCSSLKILTLTSENMNLLQTNPDIEELSVEGIDYLTSIYQELEFLGVLANFKLKKLQISRNSRMQSLTSFKAFLKSQSETLEEVNIDLDTGEDCHKAFSSVFEELKVLRKLVISYNSSDSSRRILTGIAQQPLNPNPSITELRLRFRETANSRELSKKFATACPNLKRLYVHEMDQSLIETCASNLKHLESIFTFSLRIDDASKEQPRFEKIKQINFVECSVGGLPEFKNLIRSEQKKKILEMIS